MKMKSNYQEKKHETQLQDENNLISKHDGNNVRAWERNMSNPLERQKPARVKLGQQRSFPFCQTVWQNNIQHFTAIRIHFGTWTIVTEPFFLTPGWVPSDGSGAARFQFQFSILDLVSNTGIFKKTEQNNENLLLMLCGDDASVTLEMFLAVLSMILTVFEAQWEREQGTNWGNHTVPILDGSA